MRLRGVRGYAPAATYMLRRRSSSLRWVIKTLIPITPCTSFPQTSTARGAASSRVARRRPRASFFILFAHQDLNPPGTPKHAKKGGGEAKWAHNPKSLLCNRSIQRLKIRISAFRGGGRLTQGLLSQLPLQKKAKYDR